MADFKHIREPGVVVPAIDTASSTAALRSLGQHNIHTIAISERQSPPSFSSKYCDEVVTAPDPTVDLAAYEETLLGLAERPDVHTILPFRESDVYVLARNRQALADHVNTPWPALDTLQSVQDRVSLFAAARTAGVPIPTTQPLDDWDGRDQDVIVKPRYTLHAREYSVRFAESHTQWSSTRYVAPDEDVSQANLVAEMGHVPLVQEYIPTTDEYGFFALYDHGEPVATFQHRQRRGWKYCGGPSAYREAVDIPELGQAGRRLLDELEWHGVAMVEFLRDPETDEFKLMEVNPRFWSSLPFTVQAGVDFPHLYWLQATGTPIEADPDYDVGLAGHLLWGELLHLQSILREEYPLVDRPSFLHRLGEVLGSIVRSPRFDYLDRDDPRPFVQDLRNKVTTLTGANAQSRAESGQGEKVTPCGGDLQSDASQDVVDPATAEQVMVDGGRTPTHDES
jgi:predicted ATP-grasp superfamily ATP-dependent carboligase